MAKLKISDIDRFPFLSTLSDQSKARIVHSGELLRIRSTRTLIHKGDTVGGAYLVTCGELRIYSMDSDGKESTLYTVQPGESCLLALNCLFSELLYPAWVAAQGDNTQVVVIPAVEFKALYAQEDSVRHYVFDVLSQRVFDLMSALEARSTLRLDQRLASYLLRKANAERELAITHQQLATELGTVREVVSRTLKQLESRGLIETGWKKVRILDPGLLAQL